MSSVVSQRPAARPGDVRRSFVLTSDERLQTPRREGGGGGGMEGGGACFFGEQRDVLGSEFQIKVTSFGELEIKMDGPLEGFAGYGFVLPRLMFATKVVC